jgi:hypothetical protein
MWNRTIYLHVNTNLSSRRAIEMNAYRNIFESYRWLVLELPGKNQTLFDE